jgi:hypothetical protein
MNAKEPCSPSLGKDCCGKDIIPLPGKKLEVKTNRHTTTSGYLWGWIEGTTANTVWSDDHKFNYAAAAALAREYNKTVEASKQGEEVLS